MVEFGVRCPAENGEWCATNPNVVKRAVLPQVHLRAAITAPVSLPSSDWEAMEQAVKIMEPLTEATDLFQKDGATVATVLRELRLYKSSAHN